MTDQTVAEVLHEWCCDYCGAWNDAGARCECGTDERSWLPIEPARRNGESV